MGNVPELVDEGHLGGREAVLNGDTPDGALFLTITKRIGEYAESRSQAFVSTRLPPRLSGSAEERAIKWAFALFDEVSFEDSSIEREVMRESIKTLFTWYGAALTIDNDRCA
jgi:hypothetical protein